MDPEILKNCELRNYRQGDIILRQNEEADGMYVIYSGKVEVEMDGNIIAHLEEGDFFGEMGTLLRQPRSATIRAISVDLKTHFLSKETFDQLRKDIGEEVIAKMLERTIENCER